MHVRAIMSRVASVLVLGGVLAGPSAVEAQAPGGGRWPLQPGPESEQERIVPFMEGWYANEDGTYTISFGYLNQNGGDTVRIATGEDNALSVPQLDGVQPTVFLPGRQRGVFTVTLPADMKDDDVWWNIRNPNGEVTTVPGRTTSNAYELDWNPRPQGSMHPLVSFEPGGEEGRGPRGLMSGTTLTTSVGVPVTLSMTTRDPSMRDPNDHRYREPVPLSVVWSEHQGPAQVEFSRHESNPLPEIEIPADTTTLAGRRALAAQRNPPGPQVITLSEGYGVASVIATFSVPGEYVLRAQVDNFRASDSASGDQCCWTNGYVRVVVGG